MGMKLKSGADLCGFELSRFCVQNDVAIPDAPASGRKYFHTGTGMEGKYSLLGRERIYTGTAWRSAAYVDDLANLDLATNADYLALKEKVDLLSGEVDTDAIINNMKEVTAFLSGFAEDANLMSVLDGKLDKSGGAISGAGTIDIRRSEGPYSSIIKFSNKSSVLGYIGFNSEKSFSVWPDLDSSPYTFIHSGNIGDYAIKKEAYFSIDTALNVAGYGGTDGGWKKNGAAMVLGYDKEYRWAIQAYGTATGHEIISRYCLGGTWSDWKTIAFTDSNVASAQALVHSNGTVGATVRSNGIISISEYLILKNSRYYAATLSDGTTERNILGINSDNKLLVGYGSRWDGKTLIYGDGIECIIKDTPVMLINSSGNVLIGTTKDKGQKLQVNGEITSNAIELYNITPYIDFHYGNDTGDYTLRLTEYTKGILDIIGGASVHNNLTAFGQSYLMGNVGIGKTNPQHKLDVNGDIVASGTIACKGMAAEGSAPVGTVDKWAGSIAIGTKSQPYTHGLGTTDITVAIYEKNGNEWVQILTDVDIVNANTIRVTFGANTTVEHRIVVMG